MAQRRAASLARGWDDCVHVDIEGSEKMNGNGVESVKGARIPERVWASHEEVIVVEA